MIELARKAFEDSADVKRRFIGHYAEQIVAVATLMTRALREGRKVLLFGNGGSATDASHLAGEFLGRYQRDRAAFPAIALSSDPATVTCIANDYGYDEVFARQIRGYGQKGDIAIAISTSGNSPNVLKAVEAARALGLVTIAWTGRGGGKLAGLAEYSFVVPSPVTARIQECHITLGHVLCELIDEGLLGKTS